MTSYNYSYNVLINRLEAFAAGHFLIKRFTHGQIDMADQLQDDQYPFMHVTPDTIQPVQGGMQFGFHIMFADIPRDKEYKAEYQREVISDCIRLGQDLIAEVQNGLVLFGFDVQLINDVVFEPFMEEQKNTVTGVAFTIKLEVPWDWSACDIPAIWSVGGASGSGGSGTGYGIQLQVNGTDNIVQTLLNLEAGSNIAITDQGNGTVTIDSTGGGGGGGDYVSTEYNVNHATATGNPYLVGDRVWYNGSVYQCIANNDAINPTNPTYWTLVSVGYRLRQSPVDWDATTGDYQILNKPTIPAAQVNSDWNATSGVAQILNKPTLAPVATSGDYNDLDNLPTIPTATSELTNDSGFITIGDVPPQVQADWNETDNTQVDFIKNKPTIPVNLDDLGDVNTPAPTNGQLLTYNTATGKWIASTLSGLPPTGAAGGDLQGTYPNPVVHQVHGIEMQAGTPTAGDVWLYEGSPAKWQHQPLPASHVTNDSSVTGLKVKDALNHLSTTKVESNAAITGATATKITYDAKGLVTSGTSLAASDIPSGIDAAKIGTGVVSNTEFSYLDGVTSTIQTQLNGKQNTIGLTTVGTNLATLPNPSAIRYVRINADNSVSAISAATLKSELGGKQLAFKTADQSSNILAFADVTDLSFAVVAGRTYKFKIFCQFDVTNVATGTRWAVNGPTFSRLFYNVIWTSGTGLQSNVAYQSYDGTVTTLNSNFATNNCAIIEGIVVPSANGTLIARFANELTITSVTCKSGSYIEYEEI